MYLLTHSNEAFSGLQKSPKRRADNPKFLGDVWGKSEWELSERREVGELNVPCGGASPVGNVGVADSLTTAAVKSSEITTIQWFLCFVLPLAVLNIVVPDSMRDGGKQEQGLVIKTQS